MKRNKLIQTGIIAAALLISVGVRHKQQKIQL